MAESAAPHILVVDDDLELCQVIVDTLRNNGYNAVYVQTAEEGFASATASPPDLILSDLEVPSMGGFVFCQKLHANPLTKSIPFIFITVRDSSFDKQTAMSLGANHYMTKPFRRSQLLAQVKRLLEESGGSDWIGPSASHLKRMEETDQPSAPIIEDGKHNPLEDLEEMRKSILQAHSGKQAEAEPEIQQEYVEEAAPEETPAVEEPVVEEAAIEEPLVEEPVAEEVFEEGVKEAPAEPAAKPQVQAPKPAPAAPAPESEPEKPAAPKNPPFVERRAALFGRPPVRILNSSQTDQSQKNLPKLDEILDKPAEVAADQTVAASESVPGPISEKKAEKDVAPQASEVAANPESADKDFDAAWDALDKDLQTKTGIKEQAEGDGEGEENSAKQSDEIKVTPESSKAEEKSEEFPDVPESQSETEVAAAESENALKAEDDKESTQAEEAPQIPPAAQTKKPSVPAPVKPGATLPKPPPVPSKPPIPVKPSFKAPVVPGGAANAPGATSPAGAPKPPVPPAFSKPPAAGKPPVPPSSKPPEPVATPAAKPGVLPPKPMPPAAGNLGTIPPAGKPGAIPPVGKPGAVPPAKPGVIPPGGKSLAPKPPVPGGKPAVPAGAVKPAVAAAKVAPSSSSGEAKKSFFSKVSGWFGSLHFGGGKSWLVEHKWMALAVGTAVVGGFGGAGYVLYQNHKIRAELLAKNNMKEQMDMVSVNVLEVGVAPFQDVLTAVGTIAGGSEVELRFQTEGNVRSLNFREGDAVQAGQVIAVLDQSQVQIKLDRAKAEFFRYEKLYALGGVSKDRVDEARTQYEFAQSEINKTVLRASKSGIFGDKGVEVGEFVTPQKKVGTLVSLNSVLVRVGVIEKEIDKIFPGQPVSATVDTYPNVEFKGKVENISPLVQGQSKTLTVEARIPNDNKMLLPGMFARTKIVIYEVPSAIAVPVDALEKTQTGNVVYVVNGESQAQAKPVEIEYMSLTHAVIKSGLKVGDQVIVQRPQELKEGIAVKVVEVEKGGGILGAAGGAGDGSGGSSDGLGDGEGGGDYSPAGGHP